MLERGIFASKLYGLPRLEWVPPHTHHLCFGSEAGNVLHDARKSAVVTGQHRYRFQKAERLERVIRPHGVKIADGQQG